MHPVSNHLMGIMALLWFAWTMAILIRDFGQVVIPLFMSGVGNIVLAMMVLVDIRNTWKPMAVCGVGLIVGGILQFIGL